MAEIYHSNGELSEKERRALTGGGGAVLWLTGLSGSGKSTIAHATVKMLLEHGISAYVLDGDNLREGLTSGLGFSDGDRSENIRRIGCAAALFADSGTVAVVSAISPFKADRQRAKAECERFGCPFAEIYISTSLDECIARDTKGLYARALRGEITNFTGVSSIYEAPEAPDITIDTQCVTVFEAARALFSYVRLLHNLEEITLNLCGLARGAGEKILQIYNGKAEVSYKGDGSPLTNADLAANEYICKGLTENYPEFAILSEETKDTHERLSNPYCFVVDPLDGTKEFIKRNGEFTVNIALTAYSHPICSAVFVPVTNTLYYAAKGLGSYSCTGENSVADFSEEQKISVSDRRSGLTVMMSRSHSDDALSALLEANKNKIGKTISAGSSLKGCLIAAGEADIYYRTGLTCEWDTAAMQCVVENAGGVFRQGDGSPMTYNRQDTLNSKGFYILNSIENKFG